MLQRNSLTIAPQHCSRRVFSGRRWPKMPSQSFAYGRFPTSAGRFQIANDARRIARDDRVIRNRLRDHGTRADDAPLAYRYAGKDDGVMPDADILADDDRPWRFLERKRAQIVAEQRIEIGAPPLDTVRRA